MNMYKRIGKLIIKYRNSIPFNSFDELKKFIEWEKSEEGKIAKELFDRIKPVLDSLK